MSNNQRTRNGQPFNFEDGIKSKGKQVAYYVDNIVELKALDVSKLIDKEIVSTLGFTTIGDGSKATYYWHSTSIDADDNNNTITPTSNPTAGRWKKV